MRLMQRYNPTGGVRDFWEFVRRPVPYRWTIWGLSLASTFLLLFFVISEEVLVPPEPPKVSFISTFAEGRSEAEIVASNIANQKRKERLAAEQAARDEQVKELYRQLGRASGMDVEAMERKIAAEKAAEAAQARAQAEAAAKVQSGGTIAPAAR